MVKVTATRGQSQLFFKQVFVDIQNTRARKNFVELVALQLVKTGAATHHHGFDIKVVQSVGHAVKQNTVVRDDFVCLVLLPRAPLWVTAAQIARGQHSLYTGMPEHGLGRQTYLAEQTL